MGTNEPDEPREEEEVPAPDESDLRGSEDADDARLQLEEGDGRHLEVSSWNCTWLYDMKTDTFNTILKVMFVLLLLTTLALLLGYSLGLHIYRDYKFGEWLRGTSWLFGVYWDGTNISIALCSALFALVVDVKKPGVKPRPVPRWMVIVSEQTAHKIKEFYNKIIEKNNIRTLVCDDGPAQEVTDKDNNE